MFAEQPPTSKLGDHHYYWQEDEKGVFLVMNRMYAVEACSFLKIPIFVGRKRPE
jgi:hypothetical protein